MVILIIFVILTIIALLVIFSHYKKLNIGNLTLISGGVKTGKTQLSVALVYKVYRKQHRRWKRNYKRSMRRGLPIPEQPLIYSNVPIGKVGSFYSPITPELLSGQHRFRYGSVVYLNEVSLVSGSKDIKDEYLNDNFLQLYKLCAHFLKGGYIILDTQSPQDCHYTIKRSLSTYLYIYQRLTLPFVSLLWIRSMILVDGEDSIAIDTQQDPQDTPLNGGKKMYFRLVRNKWWKYYDRYAYSSLVSDKPVSDSLVQIKSQKVSIFVRCRDIIAKIRGDNKNEKFEEKKKNI